MDRIQRPSESVDKPLVTVLVTVQLQVINDIARKPSFRGRGLLARFSFALPRSLVGRRKTHPPPVRSEDRAAWARCVEAILSLEGNHHLSLSSDAAAGFHSFREHVEGLLAPGGDLAFIADWGNKLPGKVARIAGVLHLLKHRDHSEPWSIPIDLETMDAAISLGLYFMQHAKAAFDLMGADDTAMDARYLWSWLAAKGVDHLAVQDIWQGTRGRFHQMEPLNEALAFLERHDYIKDLSVSPGPGRAGRWRRLCVLNPKAVALG